MAGFFGSLGNWWNAYRRAIDVGLLWPACKQGTNDLDHAKAAFAMHVFKDSAWSCLGLDEIKRQIDQLQ